MFMTFSYQFSIYFLRPLISHFSRLILIHGIIDRDGLLGILDKGIGLNILLLIKDAI